MKIKLRTNSYDIIGKSDRIQEVFRIVEKAADSDSTVIIFGESGTGKELIAQALHQSSQRSGKSFIPVNCAAIPPDLLESELFGYEKGAFTGAVNTRIGRMQMAHEGSVFLDEIGDMSLTLQVKLLRVLAEREIDRVGGSKPIPIDIRVIAATHRNLEKLVEDGEFREDLFYRLNIIPIVIPALRERKSDIPLLAHHFLKILNQRRSGSPKTITPESMSLMEEYSWPGNIRELANVIERMVVLSAGDTIMPRDLPEKVRGDAPIERWSPAEQPQPDENPATVLQNSLRQSLFVGLPEDGINLKSAVEDFERELILEALEKTGWVKNKAAKLLSLNRTTLVEKLKKMKISRD